MSGRPGATPSSRTQAAAAARLTSWTPQVDAWLRAAPDGPARDRVATARDAAADADPARAEELLVTACLAVDGPGPAVPRASLAAAVRSNLARFARVHPGRLIEVRVPPFAAVQIGLPGIGTAHARGTPPNVVETDAATWLGLASGRILWAEALASGALTASGVHADLADLLHP